MTVHVRTFMYMHCAVKYQYIKENYSFYSNVEISWS